MPKLKDMLNEAMQVKLGQVYDDKTHPPFANEEQWKKQWDQKLNEAPMDKRFAKEWEKSCIALINHLKHEQKNKSNPHGAAGAHKATVEKMIKNLETVQRYPKLMAGMFGEK